MESYSQPHIFLFQVTFSLPRLNLPPIEQTIDIYHRQKHLTFHPLLQRRKTNVDHHPSKERKIHLLLLLLLLLQWL
jgi:hypothetical protein